MADVYSFEDMKNKKGNNKEEKNVVISNEVPFTSFYFIVGDEKVEVGEALFKDILPYLKENISDIANSHVKRYVVNSFDPENANRLTSVDGGFMNLLNFRYNFIAFSESIVADLEDFQQVGELLDTPEGTAVVAAIFSTAFYQKYSSFDINGLVQKNWISVSPTYSKYLLKEKDKLDGVYGKVTEEELNRFLERQLLKLATNSSF